MKNTIRLDLHFKSFVFHIASLSLFKPWPLLFDIVAFVNRLKDLPLLIFRKGSFRIYPDKLVISRDDSAKEVIPENRVLFSLLSSSTSLNKFYRLQTRKCSYPYDIRKEYIILMVFIVLTSKCNMLLIVLSKGSYFEKKKICSIW